MAACYSWLTNLLIIAECQKLIVCRCGATLLILVCICILLGLTSLCMCTFFRFVNFAHMSRYDIYDSGSLEILPQKVDFIGTDDLVVNDLMISPMNPDLTMFTVQLSNGDDGVKGVLNNLTSVVNTVLRDMFVRK